MKTALFIPRFGCGRGPMGFVHTRFVGWVLSCSAHAVGILKGFLRQRRLSIYAYVKSPMIGCLIGSRGPRDACTRPRGRRRCRVSAWRVQPKPRCTPTCTAGRSRSPHAAGKSRCRLLPAPCCLPPSSLDDTLVDIGCTIHGAQLQKSVFLIHFYIHSNPFEAVPAVVQDETARKGHLRGGTRESPRPRHRTARACL